MTTKKEVAVKNEAAELAVVPDDLMLFQDDVGAGFENADSDSFAIPFLKLLQKMSPEVDEDNAGYIQGAKAGMLLNTVTNRLLDGKLGFDIIPCAYRRSYVQWGGREGDGGFKGELTVEQFDAIKDDETKVVTLNGKHYVPDENGKVDEKKSDRYEDTRSHFVIVIDPESGEYGGAIMALASTQIKPSKMLMTALNQKRVNIPGKGMIQPPTFANKVKVTTIGKTNDKGSWSSLVFELNGMVTDKEVYATARGFYTDFTKGEAKADFSKADSTTASGDGEPGEAQEADGF